MTKKLKMSADDLKAALIRKAQGLVQPAQTTETVVKRPRGRPRKVKAVGGAELYSQEVGGAVPLHAPKPSDVLSTYDDIVHHLLGHITNPNDPVDPRDYDQAIHVIKQIRKLKGGAELYSQEFGGARNYKKETNTQMMARRRSNVEKRTHDNEITKQRHANRTPEQKERERARKQVNSVKLEIRRAEAAGQPTEELKERLETALVRFANAKASIAELSDALAANPDVDPLDEFDIGELEAFEGAGFLDFIRDVGHSVGSKHPASKFGLNPFDLGYKLGHDVIAPALMRAQRKKGRGLVGGVEGEVEEADEPVPNELVPFAVNGNIIDAERDVLFNEVVNRYRNQLMVNNAVEHAFNDEDFSDIRDELMNIGEELQRVRSRIGVSSGRRFLAELSNVLYRISNINNVALRAIRPRAPDGDETDYEGAGHVVSRLGRDVRRGVVDLFTNPENEFPQLGVRPLNRHAAAMWDEQVRELRRARDEREEANIYRQRLRQELMEEAPRRPRGRRIIPAEYPTAEAVEIIRPVAAVAPAPESVAPVAKAKKVGRGKKKE
jgi:hypothetical protein